MSTGLAYLLAAIAFGGSYLVKWWLKRTYSRWSKVENQYKVTGAQTAAAILQDHGVEGVQLQQVRGKLTDHYDPTKDILRLSQSNWGTTSVAAMAVSAHEAGHALQDHTDDVRLRLRRYLVPLAALGARFGPMVVIAGYLTGSDSILKTGALLLAGMTIFQIATLPVEFNASRRALDSLERLGLSDPAQRDGVEAVLRAAALTYVAAAATSLAYFAMIFARGRGRWIV
ncbi:MAG: zinc metallopeptidase [Acidimicrobiia bacterium]|nr:zinc metallopeptidase [Acidimicrobiia bacterium]